jgi:hypothetical protein
MRLIAGIALLCLLAACAEPVPVAEPVLDPSVIMEEEVSAAPEPACLPGEGDGIGGTGCPVAVD